jgi:hypothetical protein
MHCRAIEYGEQPEEPGEPGLGGAKQQKNGVGGVALGDIGSPLLPVGIKVWQRIGDADELVAGKQLGTPGRSASSAFQQ